MEMMKLKLMSVSVFKDILKTPQVEALMNLTDSKSPEALIRSYTELVHSIWSEGHETLSDAIAWHLKYDESFFGEAMALNQVPQNMKDAAAMDIRRLSSVSMLSFAGLKRNLYNALIQKNQDYGPIIQNMAEPIQGQGFTEEEVFESFWKNGCGKFALARAFRYEHGHVIPIKNHDPISKDDMIGYDYQRDMVLENTRTLVCGKLANNVLLYGDSGTGKSATVKSLINMPEFYQLRLVEIAKNSIDQLTDLVRMLGKQPQKFIVYIDDLSFEREDKSFSALKTALEGGLEHRSTNVAIYATSNRRHMVRESFSDRQGDDVHAKETLEERTSLSQRFGLRLAYLSLDKTRYTNMVLELCHKRTLDISDDEIRVEANRWEIQHGGRTPRVAVQLVEKLAAEYGVKVS